MLGALAATQMTVEAVKHKVHTMCGTSVSTMLLQLKDETGQLVAVLSDECRKLGYYSPRDGCVCTLWSGNAAGPP